jgi:hypothetical protein
MVSAISMYYILCPVIVIAQNVYYVYSAQGKVILDTKGKQRQLKIFDHISDDDAVIVDVNSKFSFVAASDKRLYETRNAGRFIIKSFVKEKSKIVSSNSNTMHYVLDNFIQKGKLLNGESSLYESGVVERGSDVKLFLYPFRKTLIYRAKYFVPIFNDSVANLFDEFSVTFLQEGSNFPILKIKRGDSVQIPINAVDYYPLVFLCKWRNEIQSLRLIIADKDQLKELNQGMDNLKSIFNDQYDIDCIMAQALYLEAMGCYLEALRFYKELEFREPEYRNVGLVKRYLSSH